MFLCNLVYFVALGFGISANGYSVQGNVHRRASVNDCPGYKASNIVTTDSSLTADLTLAGQACNVFSDDLKDLKLLVEYQTDKRLHVKIYDAAQQVFQVQESVIPRPKNGDGKASSSALEFAFGENPFSFVVRRTENNETLFDTTGTQLVFEKQYLRLRTKLPDNPNIYGLGEHSDSFRLPTQNYSRVLWNTESPFIPRKQNLYGSHPVYFDHRADKGTHGVFLLNSDGMKINIDKDAQGQFLEYNTIGGVLDFYFMAGKKPAEASAQYAEVVGLPAMMPYWVFGLHQCKYGYKDVLEVAEVVANYSAAGIPLETMWTDIDYMNARQDFTTDPVRFDLPRMQELVGTLHADKQHYVLILDPGVHHLDSYESYKRGNDLGVFLKNADGSNYLGLQWAGVVVWPDWLNPKTQEWWTDEFSRFFDPESGINIDAIWVDMNEASSFCSGIGCNLSEQAVRDISPQNDSPPRKNTGRPIPGFPADFQPSNSAKFKARASSSLQSRQNGDQKGLPDREWFTPKYNIGSHRGDLPQYTIWTNTTNSDGTWQYDTHNFYGATMASVTRQAMLSRRPSKRPFVLTRSTFAGSGHKVAHWFGDNNSTWSDYRVTIPQMLAFTSMHQMPMVGSDVCGFNGVGEEFMCARWAMLGAFQPFYRNHADISAPPQEFYRWKTVTEAAKKAIDARYRLMDYIYTALYYQSSTGVPLTNPLFFIYPTDGNTFGIDTQYFYGDALLISPVTGDNANSVSLYLPKDTFYDFWTLEPVEGNGASITLNNLSYSDIPVHIRGGAILPLRSKSANTTSELREQDFEILVAPGTDGTATGKLYLDDGESLAQAKTSEIEFSWDGEKFTASGSFDYQGNGDESITVEKVTLLGQKGANSVVTVAGPWKLDQGFGFVLPKME